MGDPGFFISFTEYLELENQVWEDLLDHLPPFLHKGLHNKQSICIQDAQPEMEVLHKKKIWKKAFNFVMMSFLK